MNETTWNRYIAQLDARAFKNAQGMRDAYICGSDAASDLGELKENILTTVGWTGDADFYRDDNAVNQMIGLIGNKKTNESVCDLEKAIRAFAKFEEENGVVDSLVFDSLTIKDSNEKNNPKDAQYERSILTTNETLIAFNPRTMAASIDINEFSLLIQKICKIFMSQPDSELFKIQFATFVGVCIVSALRFVFDHIYAGRLSESQIELLKTMVKKQEIDRTYVLVKDAKKDDKLKNLTVEDVDQLIQYGLISIKHLRNENQDEVYVLADKLTISGFNVNESE